MTLYSIYHALNTDTATNVICNELADNMRTAVAHPAAHRAYRDAIVTVLFHNRAPETGYTRGEIRELVEAATA